MKKKKKKKYTKMRHLGVGAEIHARNPPDNRRVYHPEPAALQPLDVGCRVWGVGCRVQGVGCRVWGAGCRV